MTSSVRTSLSVQDGYRSARSSPGMPATGEGLVVKSAERLSLNPSKPEEVVAHHPR
jgi:hypothetical protein